MYFTFCSSSSEAKYPCFQSSLSKNSVGPLSKPPVRANTFLKRDKVQVFNLDAKNVVVSSHGVPGQMQGLNMRKKRLMEPSRNLEFVRTLLIDNYDSYTYNIYQELSIVNGSPPVVVRNDEWMWGDLWNCIYEESAFDNIVISPGPGSPNCPEDIGICLRLLLECRDIPILGICLGHQALGYVHGARVVHAFEPVHGRLSEIQHNGCELFRDIPSGKNSGFKVVRYHSLVIDAESLPNELIPIAWTTSTGTLPFLRNPKSDVLAAAYESQLSQEAPSYIEGLPGGKVLMGIKHSTRPHYGLQFHPESIATCHGRQIFKNFREITKDYWSWPSSSFIQEREVSHTGGRWKPAVERLL